MIGMAAPRCDSVVSNPSTPSTAASGVATDSSASGHAPWRRCIVCRLRSDGTGVDPGPFRTPRDFCRHLRDFHSTREGGSFVCLYGLNGVCPSLPVDGVSDRDYEDHIVRDHVAVAEMSARHGSPKSTSDFKAYVGGSGSARSSVSRESTSESMAHVPSVVRDQHQWTVYMSRVNLPAVLNDPTLNRREVDIFSKTWGEAFEKAEVHPSPRLPHITADEFSKYLARTSARYKKHLKCASAVPVTNSTDADVSIEKEFPALYLRKLGRAAQAPELDTIPKIFQQPGFTLQNPDTFNAVFPWSQIAASRQEPGSKSRQSAKLLQEKLSHHLDVVEIQIAEQISRRSEAFFEAMTSHDELQDHMRRTCDVIRYLREKVRHLDRILVQDPMRILQLTQSRSNHMQVYEKLKLIATVHQTQPTIQLLLSTNDYVGALDLIATTQEVLTQELAGIQSFRHLGPQLSELEKMIDQMMQDEFYRFSAHDLNRPPLEQRTLADEERLAMVVLGALRQHKYYFIEIYEEEAITTLKAIVKQTVIEAVAAAEDIDTDGNAASLANQMRLLNYPQWMSLLNNLFDNLLVVLRRVQSMTAVVHDIVRASSENDVVTDDSPQLSFHCDTENRETSEPENCELTWRESMQNSAFSEEVEQILSQGEYLRVTGLMREMLSHVCDQAHDRCLKVLIARSRDSFFEKLALSEFVQLSQVVEEFASATEQISGRRSTTVRANMQSQASKYVGRFHEERKNKLTLILDNERWKQADVPAEFQDLVNHVSSTGQLCLPAKKFDADRQPGEFLVVDGEQYAVVGTMLMLLKIVIEYCQIITDIPSVAPEVLNRLVELLKMFNSRSCQLILGAGAVHLVGLKTISTKNLGLASRCLQLVVRYLPLFRRHFEERLTGTQLNMLKHFDHLAKDYNDHISEISNKLVYITDSMLDINLAKWEVKAPMPSACFRNVTRQLAKLHEAVYGLLPTCQIQELFQRVHTSFKRVLRLQLKKLGIMRDGGPQHGLVMADLAFYSTSLRALPGLANLDVNCDDI